MRLLRCTAYGDFANTRCKNSSKLGFNSFNCKIRLTLSMTFERWVNCYIIAKINVNKVSNTVAVGKYNYNDRYFQKMNYCCSFLFLQNL